MLRVEKYYCLPFAIVPCAVGEADELAACPQGFIRSEDGGMFHKPFRRVLIAVTNPEPAVQALATTHHGQHERG